MNASFSPESRGRTPDEAMIAVDAQLFGNLLANFWRVNDEIGGRMPIFSQMTNRRATIDRLLEWQKSFVREHYLWLHGADSRLVEKVKTDHWQRLMAADRTGIIADSPEDWQMGKIYQELGKDALRDALVVWFCDPYMEQNVHHILAAIFP